MTSNKGIDLLLKAAAQLTPRFPKLCVALKGSDALYNSRLGFDQTTAALSPAERTRLASRLWYAGEALTTQRIAQLMQAADAYISPYRAEGFNLPALEAIACGLPLICTRGGSTEDFLPPSGEDFVLRINSTERRNPNGFAELVPSPAHLAELMARVMADASFRARAASAGAAWAAAGFTWRHATDKLLRVLFPD